MMTNSDVRNARNLVSLWFLQIIFLFNMEVVHNAPGMLGALSLYCSWRVEARPF